jgi:hypothetical protein
MPPKKSPPKATPSATDATKMLKIETAGFIHMPIPNDGNCFYHSLATYVRMANTPVLREKTVAEMREETVDYMMENAEEIASFIGEKRANYNKNGFNPDKKLARVVREIEKLRADGVWASELGDIVPLFVARKYNIGLTIYDWKWRTAELIPLVIHECAPAPAGPAGGAGAPVPVAKPCITVNVLRVNDGHYELIFPIREFKGQAKAVGARELARLAKYDAERTFNDIKDEKHASTSVIHEFIGELREFLDHTERSAGFIKEILRDEAMNNNESRATADLLPEILEAGAHIGKLIKQLQARLEKGPSTRSKKASNNSNVEAIATQLAKLAVGPPKPSGTRSSNRLRAKAKATTTTTTTRKAPVVESGKAGSKAKPKGKTHKSKNTRAPAPNNNMNSNIMRAMLESRGINTTNMNNNNVKILYTSLENA